MRICFVINSLGGGGAERVISILANESYAMGIDVSIFVFSPECAYEVLPKIINLNEPSKKSFIGKSITFVKRLLKLRKRFKHEQFDKIYAFMPEAYIPAVLTGFKIIVSERNNPHYNAKLLRKFALNKSVHVVANSEGICEILKDEFKLKRVSKIYNPTTMAKSYKIATEDLSHQKNLTKRKFILAVGRLHPQKNFSMLIRAFAKSTANEELNLFIVGDGPEKNNLDNIIKENDLLDKVHLLASTNRIEPFYKSCEFFVLSSNYEGYPNALLEALSFGKAVISTDCPFGPGELVKNGWNGLLVEKNNVDALAKAIDLLYSKPNYRNSISSVAKKSVAHCSATPITRKWLDIPVD